MYIKNNSYDEIYDRILKLIPAGKLTFDTEDIVHVLAQELSKIWEVIEHYFDCHTIINR